MFDSLRCGSCSRACAAGQECAYGSCAAPCGAGTARCPSGCVNLQTSLSDCGTCGRACATGQTCVAGACIGVGSLRVTLTWDVPGDMDLHVVTPAGVDIYYRAPSAGGGQLDRDDVSGTGPENIYWPATPPTGVYLVCAVPYDIRSATNFTVSINRPGMAATTLTGSRSARSGDAVCSLMSPYYVGQFTL